jgi:hypothetical protein
VCLSSSAAHQRRVPTCSTARPACKPTRPQPHTPASQPATPQPRNPATSQPRNPRRSFLFFIAVYSGIVNNQNFSRFIRYNAMQAVLLDILIMWAAAADDDA